MKLFCPGPGRSDECEFLCRQNGCFYSRPPAPRDPPRDTLPDIETIAEAMLGVLPR